MAATPEIGAVHECPGGEAMRPEDSMNQPTRIAIIAAVHVGKIMATAIVLVAACETLNWFLCWQDARRNP
jgi:hypothetical protein